LNTHKLLLLLLLKTLIINSCSSTDKPRSTTSEKIWDVASGRLLRTIGTER